MSVLGRKADTPRGQVGNVAYWNVGVRYLCAAKLDYLAGQFRFFDLNHFIEIEVEILVGP
jgi:hypothetical protein